MNQSNKQVYADPIIIGISGGSGSGKTTLCKELVRRYPEEMVLVSQDSYYKNFGQLPKLKRQTVNYDHPGAVDNELMLLHLQALKQSASVEVPEYDFATHARTGKTRVLHSTGIILVEGIMLFTSPQIKKFCDQLVYVHVEPDIRFIRRMRRDIAARGRTVDSVVKQYLETVKPMHNKYVLPHRESADIIVNGLDLQMAVRQLSDFINSAKEERYETNNFHNYTVLQPGTVLGINNLKHFRPELSKP